MDIKLSEHKKVFSPFEVTLKVNNEEEARLIYHMFKQTSGKMEQSVDLKRALPYQSSFGYDVFTRYNNERICRDIKIYNDEK